MRLVRKAVATEEVAARGEIEDETRWLDQLQTYRGRILFIHGTNDPETATAKAGYTALCSRAGIPYEVHDIAGANHSFYGLAWEREVLDLTEAWVARSEAPSPGRTPAGIATSPTPTTGLPPAAVAVDWP
jgi:pimeloyl-ACP methyl ester carboxylesterase